MKAWRIHSSENVLLEELPSEEIDAECVKIKIKYSSISLSDRLMYEGKMDAENLPLILGRGCVAMVVEVGENVVNFSRGDRVVVDPYISCSVCNSCKENNEIECENLRTYGVDVNGFLRDFAVVHQDDICKIPDRINDTDALFLEHISMAINAINKLELEKGQHLVIAGANVIGIIMAQIALYLQAIPIVLDTRQERLTIAQDLGVYYTINAVDENVKKKIFNLTGGKMAEATAHVTSSPLNLGKTLEFAKKGGKVVIVGWSGTKEELNASYLPVFKNLLTVYGMSNGAKNLQRSINMLANKTVTVEPLLSAIIDFDKVEENLKEQVDLPDKYIKVAVKI